MARLINAMQSQFDLDKWENELIELVYSNMLRQIHLVTVEEREEHEQAIETGNGESNEQIDK